MKIRWMAGLSIVLVMASCTGNNSRPVGNSQIVGCASRKVADVDVNGQWYIENIVFDDSTYVRPCDGGSGGSQYIVFEDSVYNIMTNCNMLYGTVSISGDSITLKDGMMTEMFCDDMATENALRKILPHIVTVDVENDSIIRLNSNVPSEYMVLRKAKVEVK